MPIVDPMAEFARRWQENLDPVTIRKRKEEKLNRITENLRAARITYPATQTAQAKAPQAQAKAPEKTGGEVVADDIWETMTDEQADRLGDALATGDLKPGDDVDTIEGFLNSLEDDGPSRPTPVRPVSETRAEIERLQQLAPKLAAANTRDNARAKAERKAAKAQKIAEMLANSITPEEMGRMPGDPEVRAKRMEAQGKPYIPSDQRAAMEAEAAVLRSEAEREYASADFAHFDTIGLDNLVTQLEDQEDKARVRIAEIEKSPEIAEATRLHWDPETMAGRTRQLWRERQALSEQLVKNREHLSNAKAERNIRAIDVERTNRNASKVQAKVAASYKAEDNQRLQVLRNKLAAAQATGNPALAADLRYEVARMEAAALKPLEQRSKYSERVAQAMAEVRREEGERLASNSKIPAFREMMNRQPALFKGTEEK